MRGSNRFRIFVLALTLVGAALVGAGPRSGFADRLHNGREHHVARHGAMGVARLGAPISIVRFPIGDWLRGSESADGSLDLLRDFIAERKAPPRSSLALLRPRSLITPSAPATVDVSVGPAGELVFEPSEVTINVGDTVRWTWDTSGHSVASGSSCAADNRFCSPSNTNCANAPISGSSAVYTVTFNTAGAFPYFCGPHCNQGMSGVVRVQQATPTPTTVQFDQSSYTANESQPFATINVTRAGDASAPVTVKYTTSDSTDVNFRCDPSTSGQPTGGASRKCDYHIASGRVRFAAGEVSKQIILSVVNDVYVEGPETLTIALSNPTGATLGTPSTAPVTINSDDAPGAPNPIDGTTFYVRQLYVDLLSREPDTAGWNGWISRIDLCGQPGQAPPPCDRVTVGGDGFLRSGEFFDRQFFVLRLYRTGLGRILLYPEVGDLAYVSGFLSALDLESNKQDLVAEIMSRPEFGNQYNGLTNAAFVDALQQKAGVTVPQGVRDDWVTALNGSTKTRAQVYREISERQEVSDRYLHEAQVVSAYYGFFTRNPDGAYLNFLSRLDSGEINLGDLANAFINAAEYRLRFGQ